MAVCPLPITATGVPASPSWRVASKRRYMQPLEMCWRPFRRRARKAVNASCRCTDWDARPHMPHVVNRKTLRLFGAWLAETQIVPSPLQALKHSIDQTPDSGNAGTLLRCRRLTLLLRRQHAAFHHPSGIHVGTLRWTHCPHRRKYCKCENLLQLRNGS